MATGAYFASQAERQVHVAEINKEQKAIQTNPKNEKKEISLLLDRKVMGFYRLGC